MAAHAAEDFRLVQDAKRDGRSGACEVYYVAAEVAIHYVLVDLEGADLVANRDNAASGRTALSRVRRDQESTFAVTGWAGDLALTFAVRTLFAAACARAETVGAVNATAATAGRAFVAALELILFDENAVAKCPKAEVADVEGDRLTMIAVSVKVNEEFDAASDEKGQHGDDNAEDAHFRFSFALFDLGPIRPRQTRPVPPVATSRRLACRTA